MPEVNEVQEHQVGVRHPDGHIQVVTSREIAEQRRDDLLRYIKKQHMVGANRVAVVTRIVKRVTTTTATPWKEVRA